MPKVKMASGKVKHYAYTKEGKDAAKKAKAVVSRRSKMKRKSYS